jgi:ABC-type uncharacterized transport system permease subunit
MTLVLSLLAWVVCFFLSAWWPDCEWLAMAPLVAFIVAVVGGGLWCLLYWAWTGEAPVRTEPR